MNRLGQFGAGAMTARDRQRDACAAALNHGRLADDTRAALDAWRVIRDMEAAL
jgi:hypothetical protein